MTVTQTITVPDSHRLTINVPREVPAGPVILTFTPADTHNLKPMEIEDVRHLLRKEMAEKGTSVIVTAAGDGIPTSRL